MAGWWWITTQVGNDYRMDGRKHSHRPEDVRGAKDALAQHVEQAWGPGVRYLTPRASS